MTRKVVHTDDAPAALGPYSQAIDTGDLVFCSGQVPIDPARGEIVTDDITGQTHQVMSNLRAVLAASGLAFENVVKTTIFLSSMDDFQAVNAAYGEYFTAEAPARATVEVAKLPLGARVEIEAIAKR